MAIREDCIASVIRLSIRPRACCSCDLSGLFDQYFAHELSSERPRYDLLGYDLTSQLLHTLRHNVSEEVWEGIQARIHYQSTGEGGGYENHTIHIIHQ